jgi:hypothetical protein
MTGSKRTWLNVLSVALLPVAAHAVTPPPGYIYDALPLKSDTQSCIATGPGGTFVGIGRGFTANAQAVVLVKESGDARLVAFGFSSIADCAYDATNDVLYVTDNADNADLDLTTGFLGNTGAQTGDTVFAVPAASTASALPAAELELLPADSIETIASVAVDAGGDLLVSNAAGSGSGAVIKIDVAGPMMSPLAPGFDFTGGVAVNPANGNIFVAETRNSFDNQITQLTPAGAPVPPVPFAGPSFGFGSYDLAFNSDGRLLVTGAFMGDVVAFDVSTGASTPFIGGLTFTTGISINPFTQRVEVLSSTFSGATEDKSIHRFTPVSRLAAGKGSAAKECIHELYGVELDPSGAAVCTDGAACDADGVVNDRCLFPVGFCFNVSDPALAACTTSSPVVAASSSSGPASVAIQTAAAAVAGALPLDGPSCFFSDGLLVAVKTTGSGTKKPGKGKVQIKAETADGRKDSDTFKLICQPAP